MSSLDRYQEALRKCQIEGTYRTLPQLELRGKNVLVNGQLLLNLNSNDYLGLQDEPELFQEFLSTQGKCYPPSSASSRLLTGNDSPYRAFEEELTFAYQAESALLWDSGYHANSGIIPVLTLPDTLILADRLVHASIIDGIRLSQAPFQRFRHNDVQHLETLITRYREQYSTIWIVTESLFSMDGDFAPLQEITALKHKYPQIHIYLDEAHAVGTYGHEGLGYAEALGLLPEIDILIGTLGKALGSVGAYSIQSSTLRELFISRARPLIFSTALPPLNVAWSHFVFKKVRKMQDRRAHLQSLIQLFNKEMQTDFPSQIIPLIQPGEERVSTAAKAFCENGFYIRPIRKPTVPQGSERLRLSLTAAMTPQEITQITQLCKQLS